MKKLITPRERRGQHENANLIALTLVHTFRQRFFYSTYIIIMSDYTIYIVYNIITYNFIIILVTVSMQYFFNKI